MRMLLALAVVALSTQSALCDVIIYESATGNTNDSGGVHISANQFVGSRFTLTSPTPVAAVGGTFASGFGVGSIFAAIVNMSGQLPQGSPFTGTEVLINTTFTPTYIGDHIIPLSINLPAGNYSLVFGSGVFGATGETGLSANGTDTPEGAGSYFFWNGQWNNGGYANIRFLVLGVPEPSSLPLLGLMGLTLLRRRRR